MDDVTETDQINIDAIPTDLRTRDQWVLWKYGDRDGNRSKIPFQVDGQQAKPNDSSTWTDFERASERYAISGEYEGIGYVFSEEDPFCGIDLDGCRNPETGEVQPWAQHWIDHFDSYTEVSPSGTGFKITCEGVNTRGRGGNRKVDVAACSEKEPGAEIYDRARFWTFTGQHHPGTPATLQSAQKAINKYIARYWPEGNHDPGNANGNGQVATTSRQHIVERASKYLERMEPAISGRCGHDRTFAAACRLFEFGLTDAEAKAVFTQFNARCEPPWEDRDVVHKLTQAREHVTAAGKFGKLLHDNSYYSPSNGQHSIQPAGREPLVEYEFLSLAEIIEGDFPLHYLIDRVLCADHTGIIHGGSKMFKTMTALDMSLSLASSTKMLDYYDVLEQSTVLYWSGENAKAETQDRVKRICAAKGFDYRAVADRFHLSCDLPQIVNPQHIDAILRRIDKHEAKVIVIDPTYLSLDPQGREGSMFHMGRQLAPLAKRCADRGVTFLLVHHDTQSRTRGNYDVPSFTNMAFAGFEQFARQWMSLGLREPIEPGTGQAKIWFHTGGSMGHSSCVGLDIEEGLQADVGGRRWHVSVVPFSDAVASQQNKNEDKKLAKEKQRLEALAKKLEATLPSTSDWISHNKLARRSGTNGDDGQFNDIIGEWLRSEQIESSERKAANGKVATHYRRVELPSCV